MSADVKQHERLVWIGVVLLVLFLALWDHFSPYRRIDEFGDRLKQTSIEAPCGIAAGGVLSSDEVSITCGLDETGIEAVIARAVSKFDLPALGAQVQERSADLPLELDEMALRLGLARETLIDLLRQLGANEPGGTLTAKRFAAAMMRSDPRLVVNVTSTVSKTEEKVYGEGDAE